METKLKTMAKLAFKRLTSGFWQEEQNKRKQSLAILQDQGADTAAAKNFMVASTKQQIDAAINPEDEQDYQRVKSVFAAGNAETALSVLIDKEKIKTMDENAKQRYIFDLSAKLQEYRERFEKEQQFQYHAVSI